MVLFARVYNNLLFYFSISMYTCLIFLMFQTSLTNINSALNFVPKCCIYKQLRRPWILYSKNFTQRLSKHISWTFAKHKKHNDWNDLFHNMSSFIAALNLATQALESQRIIEIYVYLSHSLSLNYTCDVFKHFSPIFICTMVPSALTGSSLYIKYERGQNYWYNGFYDADVQIGNIRV